MKPHLKLNLEMLTLKTFLRGFLVVVFFVLMLIGVVIEQGPLKLRLREGDVALKPIYAPHDFLYAGAVDQPRTERERQKARSAVLEVYSIDERILSDLLEKLDKFFQPQEFQNAGQARLEIKNLLQPVYSSGIFFKPDKTRLQGAGTREIAVLGKDSGDERAVEIEKIPDSQEAARNVAAGARKALPDKKMAAAVSEYLSNSITPNLIFESVLTNSRLQDAADAVPLQYQQMQVKKGELIISKGQRVLKEHIVKLANIEEANSGRGRFKFLAGMILLVLLLLSIVTVYLVLYEPKIFHNTSYLALIGILAIAIIFAARGIIISPVTSYMIPLASVSMLFAILLNPRLAIFMTVALSIAIGINVENSLNLAVTFLFGAMFGIFSVRNIRRRWHIIRSGVLIGAANSLGIIAIGLLNNLNFDSFGADSVWGFANGIICAFVVMGVLPLLEDAFQITTNITLLELSDMNHPLLKEMMLKAPGTYHHSLIVGNLAEAAAEEIGANSLLARLGAYYHDVGKIEKAEYFSENQTDIKSLHEKLTPSISRLIITNHVKDGVEFAKKYKLKKPLLDFIEQHHGTSLVYYFFQKALERAEDEALLKEEGFRYPGPKPQTKETAIVLLADSAEAASRTLAGPTPSRVEELTRRVINNKFIDGQLDECELALKDLNKIAEVFTKILIGVLHSRVGYPDKDNNENQRS